MSHHLAEAARLGAVLALLAAGTPAACAADAPVGADRARFRILVPDDAFVFVARERMKATGRERVYDSPRLERGRRYTYEISVIHEGREVAREVGFEPGRTVEVDFRPDFLRLERQSRPYRKPHKPIRPEWLPGRVWRA